MPKKKTARQHASDPDSTTAVVGAASSPRSPKAWQTVKTTFCTADETLSDAEDATRATDRRARAETPPAAGESGATRRALADEAPSVTQAAAGDALADAKPSVKPDDGEPAVDPNALSAACDNTVSAQQAQTRSDEDIARELLAMEAAQEREAYLASEQLALALQRELSSENTDPHGRPATYSALTSETSEDAATLELVRKIESQERALAMADLMARQRDVARTREIARAASLGVPAGRLQLSPPAVHGAPGFLPPSAPTVGSEEYKRRLRDAAALIGDTGVATSISASRAAHTISPPPGCMARKVVVVGDSGVGKTALLLRFVCDTYEECMSGTIGGTFLAKCIDVDNTMINLKIWDTAGQERFRSIIRMYYRGAAAAVLCCDLGDARSFNNIQMWADEVRLECGAGVLLEVAVTKCDLDRSLEVSLSEVHALALSLGASVTETSAKTRQGVDRLFQVLGRRLLSQTSPGEHATVQVGLTAPATGFAPSRCSRCA